MTQPLLVKQHEALSEFLDDLLAEDLLDSDCLAQESSEDKAVTPEEIPIDVAEPGEILSIKSEQVETATTDTGNTIISHIPEFTETGRIPVIPDWGLKAFQAMVFKVGELSLAIPLAELGSVIEWQPGEMQSSQTGGVYLGNYLFNGQKVAVVDLARLIFAESQFVDLDRLQTDQRITRIILIDNGKLALACDAVHEVITLQPERIRWRSTKTRRQWLAGTMLEEMIVVLDACSTAKIISDMLATADRS